MRSTMSSKRQPYNIGVICDISVTYRGFLRDFFVIFFEDEHNNEKHPNSLENRSTSTYPKFQTDTLSLFLANGDPSPIL